MPNHINATHTSNHLAITHDRTFNEKPLYYHKGGLIVEYLEDIDRVLAEALGQYPKLCVAHLNVRLSSDFDGNHSEVFSRFFRTLELETNELCLMKYRRKPHQYHQTVIRHVWFKACESTSHCHLVLFFEKRLYLCLGKSGGERSRYLSRVRKAWDRAVETSCGRRCLGLAYSPADDVYELQKGDEAFPLQLNELFYRISRLAKPVSPNDENRSMSFGCSHDSP
ncbi:YagK/YfjJ domain-containing protein [Vibrio coralliilyticus]|uniref:Inovirus Gp2 family protein n=1 Tax=Vibrio coralliilyticus TaxID=190893 RepID=A0AAP6ZUW5_9VIBR|nr:inovirus-type Gp2 protein [Vibrio coralliilyticus]NOI32203.1 inovirus Gp2 family protein [Vibrio coralliilyticus]NOI49681.1 inovirus Gp2 family protein [Vibrio coralliilyticus]NOJ25918.1 inovirus Gp2 family protein [Vibrio coralliilyticus]